MNRVTWFDIPASDINASAEFYTRVFGRNVLPKHEKDSGDELSFRVAQTDANGWQALMPRPDVVQDALFTCCIMRRHEELRTD